jgi:hypothetical protein
MSRSWTKYGDNPDKYREVKWKERTAEQEEPALHIAQQANTAICPLGEVKEDCPGYGAVGERACLSCNENAAKQQ